MNDLLVNFLRARLDEDEQVAKAAPYELGNREWPFWIDVDSQSDVDAASAYRDQFPPARALAEVASKRQHVDLCEYQGGWNADHDPHVTEHEIKVMRGLAREHLRMLALPWVDHADYRPEWKL